MFTESRRVLKFVFACLLTAAGLVPAFIEPAAAAIPHFTISSPANRTVVDSVVRMQINDPSNVARVDWFLNDITIGSDMSPSDPFIFDSLGWGPGPFKLKAVVVDNAFHETTTKTISFSVRYLNGVPLPNPVYFNITGEGWAAPPFFATRSPWRGTNGGVVTNGILTGSNASYDARIVLNETLSSPGRVIALLGLPITRVDPTSTAVPNVHFEAIGGNGRLILRTATTPCTLLSTGNPNLGPGVFTCQPVAMTSPRGTERVSIVVSTSTPISLGTAGLDGPQFGVGASGVPLA